MLKRATFTASPAFIAPCLAAAFLLSGCQTTAGYAYISGVPETRADPLLYAVTIVAVDGQAHFERAGEVVMIAPGTHTLVLEAAHSLSARGTVRKALAFTAQPCTRYVLAARRNSRIEADWQLVIDREWPSGHCAPSKS